MSSPPRASASFASRDLVASLLGIQAEKRSCVVVVRAEGATASLHFEQGKLVHAEDGTTAKALGRLLVEEGKITEEDLAGLLDALALADARGRSVRLGDLAVARSLVTRKDLSLALFSQVRKKVVAAIGWDTPDVEVQPLPAGDPGRERARFPTPLEPLVLLAFRKLSAAQLAARISLYGNGQVTAVGELAAAVELFRPKPEEREALAKVLDDPGGAALDALARGDAGAEGLAFVATLLVTGHLRREGGPASQRKRRPPPPSTVVRGAARPRFLRTAKLQMLAPIVRHSRDADIGKEAVPAKEPSPGSPAAKLHGERAFLEGKAHMLKGREALAKAELWRAHRLVPTSTEYELYLGWVTHRGDEKRAAELESLALRAKRQDPELGFASYVLSHLALLRGDVEGAEAEQQRAQRLGVRGSMHESLREPSGSSAVFAAIRPTIVPRTGRALPFRAKRPTRVERAQPLPQASVPPAPPSEGIDSGWDDLADAVLQDERPTPVVEVEAAVRAERAASAAETASAETERATAETTTAETTKTPGKDEGPDGSDAKHEAPSEAPAEAPPSARAPTSSERPSSSRIPRPTPSTKLAAATSAPLEPAPTEPVAPGAAAPAVAPDAPPPSAPVPSVGGAASPAEPAPASGASVSAASTDAEAPRAPDADAEAPRAAREPDAAPAPPSSGGSASRGRDDDRDDEGPASRAPVSEAVPAPPTSSRAPLWLAAVGLLALVGVAVAMTQRTAPPEPPPAPPVSASVVTTAPPALSLVPLEPSGDATTSDASSLDATAGLDAAPQDDGSTDASAAADPRSSADAAPRENGMGITGWKTGEIAPEGAPRGHRIFVDGHAVGETPATVSAPCGVHQVQIGSKGTPRKVDIPCGGTVAVRP